MSTRFALVRWSCALLFVVAVPALAQSSQAPAAVSARSIETPVPPVQAPAVPPHAARWDERLKNIPVAGRLPVRLSVAGQARWREEFFRAFNVGPLDDDNGQSRLMLSADLVAGNVRRWYGRVFAEGRDAQSYGRSLPGGARPSDADRHDIQNLYVDAGFGKSFVRVGRQEIALNRERLIGVPDWSNTRRGSQGARLQLVHGALAFEAVDVRPVIVRQTDANRPDRTARLQTLSIGSASGARPAARGLPAVWQAYRYEQRIRTAPSAPLTRRITSGGRLQWQWGAGADAAHGRTVEFEGARQSGRVGTDVVDGWFWITEGQWQWKRFRGKPALALGVEEASGERPGTPDRIEAFSVLYPAAHAHGGYADVIGRPNVRELHAIITWDPVAPVNLRGAAYRFDRLRLDDGVYTKQNTVFRAAGGSRTRHAADEVDLTGTWKATNHWRLIFGGALVMPGGFLRETSGGARTERWGFVGTTFSF
ncbi:alginate export family protein [Gemmatimonas aurantiaca]|uniref:alginate export family protein n=1 Tax=Gemmatimonas aurantiaca TaxID=173480 RepID=UPI00301C7DD8